MTPTPSPEAIPVEQVPDWAIARTLQIIDTSMSVDEVKSRRSMFWAPIMKMAAYVVQHEQEPVDPLLIEARQIAGDTLASVGMLATGAINAVRTGNDDRNLYVVNALAALRRGIEIGGSK